MSDSEMAEAERELRAKAIGAIQTASQLFSAFVQLRLLAMRRTEARAYEDAQRAREAAEATAGAARDAYAADERLFAGLRDADWWDQASAADIEAACAAAQRWSGASPEAAEAAREAAEQINHRGLADQVDVDLDALANARVDPDAAREFAAMRTGSMQTASVAAEHDPNAQVLREALGERAEGFFYQPMWGELSRQIDAAVADGRWDVVDLLREGDIWRDYGHGSLKPGDFPRDPAGLLAWRVENYLAGSEEAPTLTWGADTRTPPMRPRARAETIIDGDVVDTDAEEPAPADSAEPPPNPDHAAMADYLTRTWPEGADRVMASSRWPDLAERLCRLRDDGVDVTAYLQDVNLNWSKVRDPAAYLSAVIDHDQPRPEAGRRPQGGEPDPRAARVELRHREVAQALQDRWPDVADRLMTSRRWPDLAKQFDRLADARVDVPAFIRAARFELGETGAPESYLAAALDRARQRKEARQAKGPTPGRGGAASAKSATTRPASTEPTRRPPRHRRSPERDQSATATVPLAPRQVRFADVEGPPQDVLDRIAERESRRRARPGIDPEAPPAVRSFFAAIGGAPRRGPIPLPSGRSGRGPIALPAGPQRGPHPPEKPAER